MRLLKLVQHHYDIKSREIHLVLSILNSCKSIKLFVNIQI